ncbi:MAG: SDR family oxidoreductase [Deltaproteobacteria bacterium]|nr:SDR family oxidoreductase [Deltaproteobacteria bacterium]
MAEDVFDVQHKTVIVTGGLGQLGQQFCAALIGRGARVAIFDQAPAADIAARLCGEASLDQLMTVAVDVASRRSLEDGLSQVNAKWGVPFGLINAAALDSPPNAPAAENGPFEEYPEASWDQVLDVNLKGVFLCCQVIGGQMAQSAGGSIINIGSIYGVVSPDQRIYQYRRRSGAPFFKPVAYSASKSGLVNLTRYLATYWAAQKVRVNMLTLGGVFNHQDEKFLEGYCQRVPMGRMARADEYNGAIVFLLSEASAYMTGSNLVIDGGWTAW